MLDKPVWEQRGLSDAVEGYMSSVLESIKLTELKAGDQLSIEFYPKKGTPLQTLHLETTPKESPDDIYAANAWGGPMDWQGLQVLIPGVLIQERGGLRAGFLEPSGFLEVQVQDEAFGMKRLKATIKEGVIKATLNDWDDPVIRQALSWRPVVLGQIADIKRR